MNPKDTVRQERLYRLYATFFDTLAGWMGWTLH